MTTVRYTGRVIKIIDKAKVRALGIFRALPGGGGRLVPVDKKQLGKELAIPRDATKDAQDGDLIAVSVQQHGRLGLPIARVEERLGSIKSERAVSLIAIHAHDIPHVFPVAAEAEAHAAQPAGLEGREDWRKLALVTIDPVDAKDHDDAVHAAPDPDPANPGGHILTVAIADVAHYVQPGSALDREALKRGNSVYFPDRVVPMLPERISNDLCSLRGGEDRAALAVRMIIGRDGRKRSHTFHRVLMRSAAKLNYQQAQAAISGRTDEITGPLLDNVLKPLYAAYETLEEGPRRPRPARPRPARAQNPAQGRRHRRPRHHAGAAGVAPADRGVHDPRQRRGRRDAGEAPRAADLPRPRRAVAGEGRGAAAVPGDAAHLAAQGRRDAGRAVQPHPRTGAKARTTRSSSTRWCCARSRRPNIPPRTTATSA